jgi:hypothetical protein
MRLLLGADKAPARPRAGGRAKKRKKRAPLPGPAVALIAVLACILLVVPGLAVYRHYRGSQERDTFRKEPFNVVSQRVVNRALVPDANGAATLPPDLASTVPGGKVYVTQRENGLLLVLFPTSVDEKNNLRGYLFSSRPLIASDYQLDAATGRKSIEVILPAPRTTGFPTERRPVVLGEMVNRYWRQVTRTLDQ